MRKGADPKKLEAKLDDLVKRYVAPLLQNVVHVSLEDFKKSGNMCVFYLTPLTAIHLHSNKIAEFDANGSIEYVYIFSAIAVFILLIACVNFMNLSTARSANRAKEVGIRKVLGSMRSGLISQFLIESVLISLISLMLALGLAAIAVAGFQRAIGQRDGHRGVCTAVDAAGGAWAGGGGRDAGGLVIRPFSCRLSNRLRC